MRGTSTSPDPSCPRRPDGRDGVLPPPVRTLPVAKPPVGVLGVLGRVAGVRPDVPEDGADPGGAADPDCPDCPPCPDGPEPVDDAGAGACSAGLPQTSQ
ncbi:hypothetical protein [Actinomadura logoneensis]|uniref:hypothetical protein n=1 Tax=Actinomadura logoneensis TaxID=2293572 RepID=UPI001F3EBE97|nr:hypothetical protein [Actinomadura logoneensis]